MNPLTKLNTPLAAAAPASAWHMSSSTTTWMPPSWMSG